MAVSVCSLCRLNLLVPTPAWRLRLVLPPIPLLSEREGWAGVAHHIYGICPCWCSWRGCRCSSHSSSSWHDWLGKERTRFLTGNSRCRWWGRTWREAGRQQNWLVCVGREDTVFQAEWASFHSVLISFCTLFVHSQHFPNPCCWFVTFKHLCCWFFL